MSLDVFTPVLNVPAKGATVKIKKGQSELNGAITGCGVLAPFDGRWPLLNLTVVPFAITLESQ